jgi:hypothetical protein
MVLECLRELLIPFVPAPNITEPIDAAIPVLIVSIGAEHNSILSTMDKPALTDPPGESTWNLIGFFGSWLDKKSNCA